MASVEEQPRTFEALYAGSRERLVGYLFYMVQDLEVAVELSQEAFARAHAEEALWDDPASRPASWLWRVAGNLAKNHLRARARHARPLRDERPSPIDPYEVIARRQARASLLAAVDALPPRYREVWLLRHAADLSCRAVAESLGRPEGTVLAQLHRARALLRRKLDEHDPRR